MRYLLVILFLFQFNFLFAEGAYVVDISEEEIIQLQQEFQIQSPPYKHSKLFKLLFKHQTENNRFIAAGLTLALGPFGAHRLYLGTDYKVPLVYSLTFGGFFVLPVVDFFVIIFTKDFERLQNNPKVIMWVK